jgi:hypothetical protein
MFTDVTDLKHRDAIVQFFELLFPAWMTQQQKIDMVNSILENTKITIKDMDESIEKGLQNGYPIEYQLSLIRAIIEEKGGFRP